MSNTSHTVNIQGAADMLKVHPKTVQDLISAGAIPAAKVGRAYVMLTRDVLRYIEARIVAQTAERMRRPTKARQQAAKPAGSRSASASAGSCGR